MCRKDFVLIASKNGAETQFSPATMPVHVLNASFELTNQGCGECPGFIRGFVDTGASFRFSRRARFLYEFISDATTAINLAARCDHWGAGQRAAWPHVCDRRARVGLSHPDLFAGQRYTRGPYR